MADGKGGFDLAEVVAVMSHFDIGLIHTVEAFNRGSRQSPKLKIKSDHGEYLLKRRASGKHAPEMVAFSHGVQIHLARQQFPLPHLISTRAENNSMVHRDHGVYGLFEFISGGPFDFARESTFQAGRTMGLFHKLAQSYQPQISMPPRLTYHAHPDIPKAFRNVAVLLKKDNDLDDAQQTQCAAELATLRSLYQDAAAKATATGLETWPKGLVHGDFHPGNCLFTGHHVSAVIDFDSCYHLPHIIDTANAALQFSIRLGQGDPRNWNVALNTSRLHAFIAGYESIRTLSQAEIDILPDLMIESLICEVMLGLSNRGRLRDFGPPPWLFTVHAKIAWIQEHRDRLMHAIGSGGGSVEQPDQ